MDWVPLWLPAVGAWKGVPAMSGLPIPTPRTTIKAHNPTPHRPRPYGSLLLRILISPYYTRMRLDNPKCIMLDTHHHK
ncbi:MAG TPA: hypothetical protein VEH81_07470 [Ktedonobacteraceae bacterium]|nr:hypothetical protein [Ktedonobacteraceae bacterium]